MANEQEETVRLTFTCPAPDFDWGDVDLALKWVKKHLEGQVAGTHNTGGRSAEKILALLLERYEQAIVAAVQQEMEETWRGTHAPGSVPPWLSRRDWEGSEE